MKLEVATPKSLNVCCSIYTLYLYLTIVTGLFTISFQAMLAAVVRLFQEHKSHFKQYSSFCASYQIIKEMLGRYIPTARHGCILYFI